MFSSSSLTCFFEARHTFLSPEGEPLSLALLAQQLSAVPLIGVQQEGLLELAAVGNFRQAVVWFLLTP